MQAIWCLILLFIAIAIHYIDGNCDRSDENFLMCADFAPKSNYSLEYFNSYKALAHNVVQSSYMNIVKRREIYYTEAACKRSAEKGFQLTVNSNQNIPILLIETLECSMTGNILGSTFEGFAYAMENNIAMGRLIRPHSNCKGGMAELLHFIPELLLPINIINDKYTVRACDSIAKWPWESPSAHMWRKWSAVGTLNHAMVLHYLRHQASNSNNIDTVKLGDVSVSSLKHALVVHVRCGDNLYHTNMGLLSMHFYHRAITHIIPKHTLGSDLKEVLIFTDANFDSTENGALCKAAIEQLTTTLQSAANINNRIPLRIANAGAHEAYVSLQMAKAVICSISTFCFFAAAGNQGTVILPTGTLFSVQPPSTGLQGVTTMSTMFYRPGKNSTEEFLKIVGTNEQ